MCYVELNQYNKYSLVQPEELTPGQDPVTTSHIKPVSKEESTSQGMLCTGQPILPRSTTESVQKCNKGFTAGLTSWIRPD